MSHWVMVTAVAATGPVAYFTDNKVVKGDPELQERKLSLVSRIARQIWG